MQTVIQRYYYGFIRDEDLLDVLEDAVKEWHENTLEHISLHSFLGMCIPEYELWVNCPNKFVKQMHHQSYHPMFLGITD